MPSSKELHAYIHQEIVPLSKAFLHISDLSVQRGYGVFEFFRMKGQKPLFLNDYLDRFYRSASLMELEVPLSRYELTNVVAELAIVNELEYSGIKMILTGGYSEGGYEPGTPNLIITQQPLKLPPETIIKNGIKIITYEHGRELAQAKTINYTTGIRLIKQLKANAADDVLYHLKGEVLEFPRCNFFLVKQDNTIITPHKDVLLGVTRKNVLQLAGKKYKAVEGKITLQDIAQAKEAFLTSTTKRILPIVQVNDLPIGDGKAGPITTELLNDLIAFEEEHVRTLPSLAP